MYTRDGDDGIWSGIWLDGSFHNCGQYSTDKDAKTACMGCIDLIETVKTQQETPIQDPPATTFNLTLQQGSDKVTVGTTAPLSYSVYLQQVANTCPTGQAHWKSIGQPSEYIKYNDDGTATVHQVAHYSAH